MHENPSGDPRDNAPKPASKAHNAPKFQLGGDGDRFGSGAHADEDQFGDSDLDAPQAAITGAASAAGYAKQPLLPAKV